MLMPQAIVTKELLNNVFNGEGTYIDETGEETVTMYENGRAVGESKVIDKENVKPEPEENKNVTKIPEEKKKNLKFLSQPLPKSLVLSVKVKEKFYSRRLNVTALLLKISVMV